MASSEAIAVLDKTNEMRLSQALLNLKNKPIDEPVLIDWAKRIKSIVKPFSNNEAQLSTKEFQNAFENGLNQIEINPRYLTISGHVQLQKTICIGKPQIEKR